jgi:hypothetical protein
MEYILILKNGIGNKIFTLINCLHRYPKHTFYIVDKTTHHQEGNQDEKIWNLFPLLKEHPRIKFIRWSNYDKLKESIQELEVPWKIFYEIDGFTKGIKKYFHPTNYEFLETKLDFKKGIFVHVRLGDKFEENIKALKAGNHLRYIIMKPEYYQDYISYLRKKDEPVYILSDDLEMAERMLPGYEYPDLNVNETFYCFQNARRVILSESTLSISAVLLGIKKKDLVIPNFLLMPNDEGKPFKLIKSPYFSDGESSRKYIMTELKDFEKLKKM